MKARTAEKLEQIFNENEKDYRNIKNISLPALRQVSDDLLLQKKMVKRIAYLWAFIGITWIALMFYAIPQEKDELILVFCAVLGLVFLFMSLSIIRIKVKSELQLLIMDIFITESEGNDTEKESA